MAKARVKKATPNLMEDFFSTPSKKKGSKKRKKPIWEVYD